MQDTNQNQGGNSVDITVCGVQKSPDFAEELTTTQQYQGVFRVVGNAEYIQYQEQIEEIDTPVVNRMKIDRVTGVVELLKRGPMRTQMQFVLGQTTPMNYETPYGTMCMAIRTKDVKIIRDFTRMHIAIVYDLEMDGKLLSENTIDMNVVGVNF